MGINPTIIIKGCYEVSLGDTIGIGTEEKAKALFDQLNDIDSTKLASHFHDTYDRAISNLLVSLEVSLNHKFNHQSVESPL
jgi:hydroxymethylglutaryl-CoA lyase